MVCGLAAHGDIFAVLNKAACQYMHHLIEAGGIRLEGLISRTRFLAARAKETTTISMDVNVYGKREDAFNVGQVLSSFGVHLQQPICGLEHATYYNPHFLHVEELLGQGPVPETPRFEIDTKTNFIARGRQSNGSATLAPEQRNISTDISNVLASLSHHAILSKKAGAVALKSELKE